MEFLIAAGINAAERRKNHAYPEPHSPPIKPDASRTYRPGSHYPAIRHRRQVRHLPSAGGHRHRRRNIRPGESDPVWGGIRPARSAAGYHLCGIRVSRPGRARPSGRVHRGRRRPR